MQEADEVKAAKKACTAALQAQSGLTVAASIDDGEDAAASSTDGWPPACSPYCAGWKEDLDAYRKLAGCSCEEVGICHLNCGLVIYEIKE